MKVPAVILDILNHLLDESAVNNPEGAGRVRDLQKQLNEHTREETDPPKHPAADPADPEPEPEPDDDPEKKPDDPRHDSGKPPQASGRFRRGR